MVIVVSFVLFVMMYDVYIVVCVELQILNLLIKLMVDRNIFVIYRSRMVVKENFFLCKMIVGNERGRKQ